MKDSQDWLGTILGNLACEAEIAGSHLSDISNDAVKAYKKKIQEHFLKEALELIGDMEERETEDMSLQSWGKEDYKAFGRNELRAELRTKLTDTWGGK